MKASPPGCLDEQQGREEVEGRPEELRRQNRTPEHGHQEEGPLGEGRIDGGDVRVVDEAVPRGADGFESLVRGGVAVGVDAFELHVAVPEIPVDVVGELWSEGDQ